MVMTYLLLFGFLLSGLTPLVYRYFNRSISPALLAFTAISFGWFITKAASNFKNPSGPISEFIPWVPQLGINISLRLDDQNHISNVFALLITGVGFFIILYAYSYAKEHRTRDRLVALLMAFMTSMLGLVLANNFITLFLFWELTSIFSYLLISYKLTDEIARENARQSLIVTSFGGIALLIGFILIGDASGTLEIHKILDQHVELRNHDFYPWILGLIVLGCATKSAQFPFHFWLPRAMVAPTPVSAYLHSATMVKAGVFLLLKLQPILGGTDIWYYSLCAIGATTMLISSLLALRQTDLKLLLAYSTLGSLGLMFVLIGIESKHSLSACLLFILAHALYKAASFLIAGSIEYQTHIRHIGQLGGLSKIMRPSFIAGFLACGSMIGAYPFLGFVAKESLWNSLLMIPQKNTFDKFLLFTTFTSFAIFTTIGCATLISPFLKKPKKTIHNHKIPTFSMNIGPIVFAFLGFILGLFGDYLFSPIRPEKHLKWFNFEIPLVLSVLGIVIGVGLFTILPYIRKRLESIYFNLNYSVEDFYYYKLELLERFAFWQTRIIQNGHLRYYISTLIAFTAIVVMIPLLGSDLSITRRILTQMAVYEYILVFVILGAAIVAITTISRLGAIVALGVVGYCISITYLFYGAPDLSMTQFLVDTLSIIVFVLVFYHLPKFSRFSTRWAKIRDAIIAISFGIVMCLLVLSVADVPLFPLISDYMADNSVGLAHGRNIVNTILVDFRGLDTLGEITVLSLASIGIYGLLKLRIPKKEKR